MAKTLVVKLAGTVDNPDLQKLGEMYIRIVPMSSLPSNQQQEISENTQGIQFTTSRPIQLKLIGDGHFTDSTLTQNLGTSVITAGNNTSERFYVSDGASTLYIEDKYAIACIGEDPGVGVSKVWRYELNELNGMYGMKRLRIHFAYICPGSIDMLSKMSNLEYLHLVPYDAFTMTGDLSTVRNLTKLSYLNFNSQMLITGQLSDVAGLTQLTYLNLGWLNRMRGQLSSLAGLTNLTRLELQGCTGITGDTSSLAHLHPNNGGKLSFFSYNNTNITGEWPPATA